MISKIENQIHENEEKKPTLMITMHQVLECHHRLIQQPHFTDQKVEIQRRKITCHHPISHDKQQKRK